MTKARRPGRKARTRSGSTPSWLRSQGTAAEVLDGVPVQVRFLQPYQAGKDYLCPGCYQVIPPGTGHMVVVPVDAPEDRRHWHRSCWQRRIG